MGHPAPGVSCPYFPHKSNIKMPHAAPNIVQNWPLSGWYHPAMLAPLLALAMMAPSQTLQVVEEESFQQLTDTGLTSTLTIKAILPDGSHALLFCGDGCAEVQSLPPEKRLPTSQTCTSDNDPRMGYVHNCKYTDVGIFEFKRSGDKITIWHRAGKTTFKVTSSW